MTGQILGGSDPSVAARYQIVIYYLVAISSSLSAVATIYAAVLTVCDGKHRLRVEKLESRKSRSTGAIMWLGEQCRSWALLVRQGLSRAFLTRQDHSAALRAPLLMTRNSDDMNQLSTGQAMENLQSRS
jgi:hypothetical protein